MYYVLKNARVYMGGHIQKKDIIVENGTIVSADTDMNSADGIIFNFENKYIFPGFVDVHVHFREPGFSYKETIKTGTMAAAAGGYTSVCTMPNISPTPDSLENLKAETDIIDRDAVINVYPYGTITKGEKGEELSDMDKLAKSVIAFSDDGKGVQNEEIMHKAMIKARDNDKIIAAHCELNALLSGGCIHAGKYAATHGHKGISSESEWREIERDIYLLRETGCRYHVCHVSTKESVELIRRAKKEGLNITCETAPHYLVLNDMDLSEDGRFKMNPPIRDESDRLALIEGLNDGTIDIIATDHAPHSEEEKSKGLEGSLMGVTGLEVAFPILYSKLVCEKSITLNKLLKAMTTKPASIFGLKSGIKPGYPADLCVYDLEKEYTIDSSKFLSKGKSTPFEGATVRGKCLMTMCGGKVVYINNEHKE